MCKREHTHKSVVKSNTVGMVVTCDLAFFSLGERYCKNARLKNNFFGTKMYAGGGGRACTYGLRGKVLFKTVAGTKSFGSIEGTHLI